MIWIIAGTRDGREIAAHLADSFQKRKEKGNRAPEIFLTVVSTYGKKLAMHEGIEVEVGRFTKEDMVSEISKMGITAILDASHPYAAIVSETAREAAAETGVSYIRYERPGAALPDYEKLHVVSNEAEAAETVGRLGNKILLTTGSKTLKTFVTSPFLAGKEIWARVLPTSSVLSECEALGLLPKYILALQGPFSYKMNAAMIHDYEIDVLVTKNSGLIGGSDKKFSAAVDAGIHIVVIEKPKAPVSGIVLTDPEEAVRYMEEHYEFH